ncbi:putative ABC transporter permease [Indibacter alkaliphilus LW1]|uniref:ABC transporter permease n=1 Tax=Indibacter alkaliphilus (strain CCUG 57479 / KCTC 22604 / LW1) TaxID=1189612 RepID=S2DIA6_INDAL|nr:ABC transporter permease [Indibacter alkaliphilus]EOZ98754.1 putative ABC transporter permease [Indibacter alkaliphilus LW1]
MFRNILKIALRNFWKTKSISFINVLGLSLGMALCMIIAIFVKNELSYDRHFPNAERIYRISSDIVFGGNAMNMTFAPAPMAEALVAEIPEVEAAVHFRQQGSFLIKRYEDNIKENDVVFAGKSFLDVFDIPLVQGSREKALDEPNTMLVSQSLADKFFKGENAIGQSLILDNKTSYSITGVFADIPENSHFQFHALLAAEGLAEAKSGQWLSNNFQTYLLVHPGSDPNAMEEKIRAMSEKHMAPVLKQVLGEDFTLEQFKASGNKVDYGLQPLLDIHLHSDLLGEFKANFSITYIYLFIAIAVFILLIACINFMNLATAKSSNRAKEVGVRKTMGSGRNELIGQFLGETFIMSLFSFLLAILLASLLLPFFNDLAGRSLKLPLTDVMFYLYLLLGALIVGLIAGAYPALFLSGFNPSKVLKGDISKGMKSSSVRSSLVVFQFAISIILIFCTIVLFSQMNFIQNKNLGFSKDQIIMVHDLYAMGSQKQAFKEQVISSALIEKGTLSGYLPVSGTNRSDTPWWVSGRDIQNQENLVSIQNWRVDFDYISTLGMKVIQGRDFSLDFPSDSSGVILNETAVKNFNFDGDPIGQKISSFSGDNDNGFSTENAELRTVIGVVENFHFESLKENIGAVLMFIDPNPTGIASFKFQAEDTKEVLSLLEGKWNELAPGQPFTYSFLDDRFASMYASETRIGKVFAAFTGFAIFIACMGLFALTAFTAEQRRKEIGIRKTLGASVSSLVLLLSKEFTKLVLIAFVIAAPLGWYGMNKWLQDYTYRIDLGWTTLLIVMGLVMAVAWTVMGVQSFRAARINPVDSLKGE